MSILIKHIITEKATNDSELFNRYTFVVDKNANKVEIKKAVESLFNVGVDKVSTVQVKGKRKQRGRIVGKRRDWNDGLLFLV